MIEIPSPEELLLKVDEEDARIQYLLKWFEIVSRLPGWRGGRIEWKLDGKTHASGEFTAIRDFLLVRGWDFRFEGLSDFYKVPTYSLGPYKPRKGLFYRLGKAFRIIIGKENER